MSTGQMFKLGRLKRQLLQPDIIKVKVKVNILTSSRGECRYAAGVVIGDQLA